MVRLLRLSTSQAPVPSARAGERSLRRCKLCRWWKLTEEVPAPSVPQRVLDDLRSRLRACTALVSLVRDLLMPQSSLFTLMGGEVAARIVGLLAPASNGTGVEATPLTARRIVLRIVREAAPRLFEYFRGVHDAGEGGSASALLCEVALRVAQTRILLEQHFGLHLHPADADVERISLPGSHLPAVSGVHAYFDCQSSNAPSRSHGEHARSGKGQLQPGAAQDSGAPSADAGARRAGTGLVVRQFVTVYKERDPLRLPRAVLCAHGIDEGGGSGDGSAAEAQAVEVVPIPHLLWNLLPYGARGLHIDKDKAVGGRQRRKEDGTQDSLADHRRKPHTRMTAGIFVFFCEHAEVSGAFSAPLRPCR